MKNILSLLAVILLVFTSNSLFAQNYYVCDTGDDSNSGKLEIVPFKTFGKAIATFNTMQGGDSVLFCRGGQFQSSGQRIMNKRCSTSSVCTMTDYGDSRAERPLISTGSTTINFGDGGKFELDGGYLIENLTLISTKTPTLGVGVFVYNNVNNVVLNNLHIEGFAIGVQVADGLVNKITLKNSVIINNSAQGWLGGCDYCLIEDNLFENNGFDRAVFNHNIYVSSPGQALNTGMAIRGNTLYKSTIVNGKCSGVSLVVHGLQDNLVIENNLIKEDAGHVEPTCWGISVDPGYASEEAFQNIVIKGNKLLNMGNIGIGCASCNGALIENNVIIDEGEVLGAGIAVPVRNEDKVKSKNVRVVNNTIVISKTKDSVSGILAGGVNPVVVVDNDISLPTNSKGLCVRTKDASANIDISSNICKNHTSISVIDKTVEEPTTASTSIEPTSTASTSTEPTSTASTSTEPTSTASTSTEPTSTASTSSESTATASTSTEPTITEPTSTIEVVSLGSYKRSRGKQGGGVGFRVKCRAQTADGRCLLQ